MTTAPIRVAIVEDLQEIRTELAGLVASDEGMQTAGIFADGETALKELPGLNPDVVLMDIGLPGISGVECVERLKPQLPATNFMMLTVFEDHERVFAALQAGATGYLVKGSVWERIREAILELHAGGSPMSSSIAREVIRSLLHGKPGPTNPESRLSMREEEILRALAAGKRYKEIAADLDLSPHTVRTHLHRIYQKLHVRNKQEAVAVFRRGHH
jgi:DNA-binding NarL/FixJ family response regulator